MIEEIIILLFALDSYILGCIIGYIVGKGM